MCIYICAGNLTGWVAFRLEDVRETEGEKQNQGRTQQRWERRENIETQNPPLIWWEFFLGGSFCYKPGDLLIFLTENPLLIYIYIYRWRCWRVPYLNLVFLPWSHETWEDVVDTPLCNRAHKAQFSTRDSGGFRGAFFHSPQSRGLFFASMCSGGTLFMRNPLLKFLCAPVLGTFYSSQVCSDFRRDTAWEWDEKGFWGRCQIAELRRILGTHLTPPLWKCCLMGQTCQLRQKQPRTCCQTSTCNNKTATIPSNIKMQQQQ